MPSDIQRFASASPFEPVVGYSRSVRAGPFVFVSGTTGTVQGELTGRGDLHAQARQALLNVVAALEQASARPEDVVQTRMYVSDIGRWEEAARAHAEVFGEIRPVTSMVEVAALIDPEMLFEVEAVAYVAAS